MSQYTAAVYPVVGKNVNPNEVGKLATTDIIERIFRSSMLCREYIKTSPAGQAVVPIAYLDFKANIPNFYPGKEGTPVTAKTVYDSLVLITKWLLKVGSYNYYEYKRCSGVGHDRENEWRDSGIALFSDSYAASNVGTLNLAQSPADGGVTVTEIMSVNNLKALATSCYNSWNNSRRPSYSNTYEYCHNSCHDNCHNSCHDDCHTSGHTDTREWGCHADGPAYSNNQHYLGGGVDINHGGCHTVH